MSNFLFALFFPRLCQRKLLYVFYFRRRWQLRALWWPRFLLRSLRWRRVSIHIRTLRLRLFIFWRLLLIVIVTQWLLLLLRLFSFRRTLLWLRLHLPFWLLSFTLLWLLVTALLRLPIFLFR